MTIHTVDSSESIQDLIDAASDGDTIKLLYGFYNQRFSLNNKSLKIVGCLDKKTGAIPVVQHGERVTKWKPSTLPEHTGKNIWTKEVPGTYWIRSLTFNGKNVPCVQAKYDLHYNNPNVPSPETYADVRDALMSLDWQCKRDEATGMPLFFLPLNSTENNRRIDWWKWYDATAGITSPDTSTGLSTIYLRLKNNLNPNRYKVYLVTSEKFAISSAPYHSIPRIVESSAISLSNCNDCELRNIEIRGGWDGVRIDNSSGITVENCKIIASGFCGIEAQSSNNLTIRYNDINGAWMQSNIGSGWLGSTERAYAAIGAYTFGKHYAIGYKGLHAGHCVLLGEPNGVGNCTNVVIENNILQSNSEGVYPNAGQDVVVRNNYIHHLYSCGVVIPDWSTVEIEKNHFFECNIAVRFHRLDAAGGAGKLRTIPIANNIIHNSGPDQRGYVLLSHYNSQSSNWPVGTTVEFKNNFVQNGGHLFSNIKANKVHFSSNVIDMASMGWNFHQTAGGFEGFETNWVGGKNQASVVLPWFGTSNTYAENQRLAKLTPPAGFALPNIESDIGNYSWKKTQPT